eukprot:TRINITY_DN705_c0_g1_i3.p1 TRINITY_DN705_c0_g1~~TRINITY_DN705_c0_g1_i3.p1  ORF type:complete len:140 (-),score=56.55 TRINITY_DN705_c0_g1_i3:25-444(-)
MCIRDRWKTYPQVFINGKLVGGLDVTKDLITKGKFLEMVPAENKTEDPKAKLMRLISSQKIMVLTNGNPVELEKNESTPEETKRLLKLISERKADFYFYNYAADEGIKPLVEGKGDIQVFVDGKHIGGASELLSHIEAK